MDIATGNTFYPLRTSGFPGAHGQSVDAQEGQVLIQALVSVKSEFFLNDSGACTFQREEIKKGC